MDVYFHFVTFTCILLAAKVINFAASTRNLKKICKASEIEVFSEHGVRIEGLERSHVELSLFDPLPRKRHRFQIRLDFKTSSPNGILFYGRSRRRPGQLIAISLQGGYLIYKIQCPTLHADLLIPTREMKLLNDNQWHTVVYSMRSRAHEQTGFVQIDGYTNSKRYQVSCSRMTSLVIGGLSPKDKEQVWELQSSRIPGHFEGCIRNLFIPTPLRSPPKYRAVSVCD